MFQRLPKSRAAADKAAALSPLERALLDMSLMAAFGRPDSYLELIDYATTVRDERKYEIFVVAIDIAILSLVFSDRGRVGITDFELLIGQNCRPSSSDNLMLDY